MERWAASSAREHLAEILNRVAYGGARIVLHRHGRDVVAIVPMEDLQRLQPLPEPARPGAGSVVRRSPTAARRSR